MGFPPVMDRFLAFMQWGIGIFIIAWFVVVFAYAVARAASFGWYKSYGEFLTKWKRPKGDK